MHCVVHCSITSSLEEIISSANRVCNEIKKAHHLVSDYGNYLGGDFYANSFSIEPYLESRWKEVMSSIDIDSMKRDISVIYGKLLLLNSLFPDEYTNTSIDLAIDFSHILGHKKNPEHPEETLQKTIQNLRNKGFIEFLGNGKYILSEDGYNKMTEEVNSVKDLFSDR